MAIYVWGSLKVSQEGTILTQLCKAREDMKGLSSDAESACDAENPLGEVPWGTFGPALTAGEPMEWLSDQSECQGMESRHLGEL